MSNYPVCKQCHKSDDYCYFAEFDCWVCSWCEQSKYLRLAVSLCPPPSPNIIFSSVPSGSPKSAESMRNRESE